MTFKRFTYTEQAAQGLEHYAQVDGLTRRDLHDIVANSINRNLPFNPPLPNGCFRARIFRDADVVYSAKGKACRIHQFQVFHTVAFGWTHGLQRPPALPKATVFHPCLAHQLFAISLKRKCTQEELRLHIRNGVQEHHAQAVLTGRFIERLPVLGLHVLGLVVYYVHDARWMTIRGILDPLNPQFGDAIFGEEIRTPDDGAIAVPPCPECVEATDRHASSVRTKGEVA